MTDTITFFVGFIGPDDENMQAVTAAINATTCLARVAEIAYEFQLPGDYQLVVQSETATELEFKEAEALFKEVFDRYKTKLPSKLEAKYQKGLYESAKKIVIRKSQ